MATTTSAYEMDGVGVSAVNNAADQISRLKGIAQSNSAFNAEQAQLQREWTEQQNAKAMQFNRIEAKKNRDWQEMMSNTAHQREVKDLMAGGLNPVLSCHADEQDTRSVLPPSSSCKDHAPLADNRSW